jgi:regulatory protein
LRAARHKPVASLRATALRLLARRDYPRAALEARLLARGAERDDVTRLLDDLERQGYLSDARHAQMLVAQKVERFGRRAIAHALHARRVDPVAAREALATLADGDEVARATAVWTRRFGVQAADERERARQIRFLLARGYGLQVALAVVGRCGIAADVDAGGALDD